MKSVRIPLLLFLLGVLLAVPLLGCAEVRSQGFSGIVADGEMLYVGSADGRILALNPGARAGGEPFPSRDEWDFSITTEVRGTFGCGTSQVPSTLYATPVLSNGHICIGTYEGKVLMVDPQSRIAGMVFPQLRAGEWLYPRTEDKIGPVVGNPSVEGDTVVVSSSRSEGSRTAGVIYAVDRLFGDELWVSEPLDGKLWATPAVVDGVVYVSTFEGHIYSLDLDTGGVLPWIYKSEFGFVSSPLVTNEMLYIGAFDRSLLAIPLGGDEPSWRLEADNWFWATPVVEDGVMYAVSLDGRLYAVDALSGAPLWVEPYNADDPIAVSPVIAGDDVVVVTQAGDVHIVNRDTGMGARVPHPTNDRSSTCGAEVVAPPCYHEGLVYVRAQNNVLCAIDPVSRSVLFTFSLKME